MPAPQKQRYRVKIDTRVPPYRGLRREGEVLELTDSAARYPLLRGRIEAEPPASTAPVEPAPAPSRTRRRTRT